MFARINKKVREAVRVAASKGFWNQYDKEMSYMIGSTESDLLGPQEQ